MKKAPVKIQKYKSEKKQPGRKKKKIYQEPEKDLEIKEEKEIGKLINITYKFQKEDYSKEIKDKLKNIYDNIKNEKFEEVFKPIQIKTCPYISDDNIKILEKLASITEVCLITPIELKYKELYEKKNKISTEPDKCSICQYNFYESNDEKKDKEDDNKLDTFENYLKMEIDTILLSKCSDHFFHFECLSLLLGDKNNFKCPNCTKIYGILIGDMPYGTMKAYIQDSINCDGYNDIGTIVILYNIPSGNGYSGTIRECYLPNNKEGKEVLGLLKVAFDRKMTFVVGTSVTTGRTNTAVWNGIHHKTNLYGGPTSFGYPDPTYFNRVKEELAAKGVIKENIKEDLETIADNLIKSYKGNKIGYYY